MEKNSRKEDLKNRKGKKRLRCSIFFFLFGFLIMIFCAILQEKKIFADELIIGLCIIGFIVCALISLCLAIMSYPDWVEMEAEKIYGFYNERELTYLPFMDRNIIEKRISELKFKYIKEGLYRKWSFIFSLYKDHICYYVRIIENNEFKNAAQKEVENFALGKKDTNVCLLLMIYMDKIDDEDKDSIKEYSRNSISREIVLRSKATILTIAVDKSTNVGYYLDIGKDRKSTLYSYGCKMIKRLCAEQFGVKS